jgi:hypothetical protein
MPPLGCKIGSASHPILEPFGRAFSSIHFGIGWLFENRSFANPTLARIADHVSILTTPECLERSVCVVNGVSWWLLRAVDHDRRFSRRLYSTLI